MEGADYSSGQIKGDLICVTSHDQPHEIAGQPGEFEVSRPFGTVAQTASISELLESARGEKVNFSETLRGSSRHVAATKFAELLQLKTWGSIDVYQDRPFGDIQFKATAVA